MAQIHTTHTWVTIFWDAIQTNSTIELTNEWTSKRNDVPRNNTKSEIVYPPKNVRFLEYAIASQFHTLWHVHVYAHQKNLYTTYRKELKGLLLFWSQCESSKVLLESICTNSYRISITLSLRWAAMIRYETIPTKHVRNLWSMYEIFGNSSSKQQQ